MQEEFKFLLSADGDDWSDDKDDDKDDDNGGDDE